MSTLATETRDDISVRVPEGWWQTNNAAKAEGWPEDTNSWYHLISATHSNESNYYALQISGGFFDNEHFYIRKTANDGMRPWRELWHTGNFDPNSKANLSGADFLGPVTTRGITATSSGQVNKTYASTFNPDAVVIGAGNSVSFAPEGSSILGPRDGPYDGQIMPRFFDHQRASLLVSATTALDAQAQEQAIAVTFTNNKGEVRYYAPNTYYSLGQNVRVPRNDGSKQEAVYRCIQAGTTGANSAPPGGRPWSDSDADFIRADGSVKWLWINDFAINAKVGQYIEVKNKAGGGGNAWGFCVNSSLERGFKPGFTVAQEINLFNDSGIDSDFGVDVHGLSIAMMGPNTTAAALSIGTPNDRFHAGSRWGIRISGSQTVNEAAIALDLDTRYGIAANQFDIGGGNFDEAFIFDRSTSNSSVEVSGTKRVATIIDAANSPTALSISGNKSFAGIYEHSTTPVGLKLLGSYGALAIEANGFTVNPWGDVKAKRLCLTGLPTSANGLAPGDVYVDGNTLRIA
ncbi:hypothetical protein [Methylobacterium ajmalii]|uniref:hypothetical protein n=1 Tax=Methylobacterium ajmalii TaxID=2738439 RepID=UPI002F35DCB0